MALVATAAPAQQQGPIHHTQRLDLTLGRHTTSGGFIDYRTGVLFDLLGASEVRSESLWNWVVGIGAGLVGGGFGDRCLISPRGGCAPQGNFFAGNLLSGVDVPLGRASARALIGPAVYAGAGATSLGLQGRADVTSPPLAHCGLGLMLRITVLPSHAADRLVAWAMGGSVTLR